MPDQVEEYRSARSAWEAWVREKSKLAGHSSPMSDTANDFALALEREQNWLWAAFKQGWDASLVAHNTILKVDELGRTKTL